MSETTAQPGRYKVIYHDQGKSENAGVVDIAGDGRLAVVSAEPRFANAIGAVVTNMNAMDTQLVEGRPPAGAPSHSEWSKTIARKSPEFIPAMLADIRGYGFELVPDGGR